MTLQIEKLQEEKQNEDTDNPEQYLDVSAIEVIENYRNRDDRANQAKGGKETIRSRLIGESKVHEVGDGVGIRKGNRAELRNLLGGAECVVVAVPIGPPSTIDDLQAEADEVVCPRVTPAFRGVGQFYEGFEQVTDEESMAYL
ncbi:hypothetical protein [Halomicrococcus sp. NG-SE-24]|uniref:hypothetical protein n=1 Tax=Halomicrococcus sp. NG-SE-24 TaxID=3436928 RepID=UPI003D981CF8